jgi:hypothetical protein
MEADCAEVEWTESKTNKLYFMRKTAISTAG